jgi:hypothetical protein
MAFELDFVCNGVPPALRLSDSVRIPDSYEIGLAESQGTPGYVLAGDQPKQLDQRQGIPRQFSPADRAQKGLTAYAAHSFFKARERKTGVLSFVPVHTNACTGVECLEFLQRSFGTSIDARSLPPVAHGYSQR